MPRAVAKPTRATRTATAAVTNRIIGRIASAGMEDEADGRKSDKQYDEGNGDRVEDRSHDRHSSACASEVRQTRTCQKKPPVASIATPKAIATATGEMSSA